MAIDLSGSWRAAIADDELRRDGVGLGFDDDGWEPVEVPGHWRSVPAFADADGPLIYRTHFELDPAPGTRHWVTFDGVFYQADVWMDGAYLGDPEGYFFPHSYDISLLAGLGREHVLAVEVSCAPQRDKRAKRNLTGVFQHSDSLDPEWNPGGIWRPVRIETTGPVRIETMRVLARDVNEARAHVVVRATLASDVARRVRVRTLVDGQLVASQERSLARGANAVEWNVDVENPRIWWPWSLGEQPLTDVTVEVVVPGAGPSDSRRVRTGLREIALNDWIMSVNGERLFLKGANIGPTRRALAEATPDDLRRDVALARDAGLDLLRVQAHVSRPELYEAADELGMLIWQDLPLQWGYARSVRRQAVRQTNEAVNRLGHHPSIAVWCGHNEPLTLPIEPGVEIDLRRLRVLFAAGQQLPTWNRTILDRWIKRAFEQADETRPVIAHSGVMPHLPQLNGTDSHLSFGWYHGHERDLPGFAAAVPRMVRFVSAFGAQAVPETADFMEPGLWPSLPWDRLERHHALQKHMFDERVPPGRYASFDAWRAATQAYQATVLRHHIETLRRLKYRPTGGFCFSLLADAQPAVSWSVLDHDRVPKLGFAAVVDACRPVIVVADRLPATILPGSAIALDLHVVNDLHHALDGAALTAELRWRGGSHEWRFGGDVPPDDCVRVGMVRFIAPDVPGRIELDLTLDAGTVAATNRYLAEIVRPE
ncbi:MAG: glycoside hydrolase family 2 protein [Acidimicrobiia bacterium]